MGHSKRYRENRIEIDKLKSKPCMDCGKTFHPVCMDFDHRLDVIKVKSICGMMGRPWNEIEVEIKKCDLVCACCHRLRGQARGDSNWKLSRRKKIPINRSTLEDRRKSFREAHARSKDQYKAGSKQARERTRRERVIDREFNIGKGNL